VDGIGRGWNCEVLSESDVADTISAPWGELNVRRCGTLVFWDDVDRLPTGKHGLRDLLRQLQRRLQTHLGMTFHRFLEGTGRGHRLRIVLDLQRESFTEASHQVEVHPLNPFGYEESGHSDYPQKFPISLGTDGDFEAEAHIWPANSVSESYRLGNKAAARQGFYFYRHDRLIQAGGWNGLVQADSEPHSSLARVSIDLPESLDHAFGLNVQKSAVVVPPTFLLSIESARSRTGASFDDYRRAAQQTYRHDDRRAERHRPVVPGAGVPAAVRRLVLSRLSNDAEVRAVDFRWASLEDPDAVFEIDRERRRVLINRRLKQAGIDDSTGDARLLKVCLYFLLQDDIDSERLSGNRRDRLSLLNEAIGRTLYS
jgi:hypothetical protein